MAGVRGVAPPRRPPWRAMVFTLALLASMSSLAAAGVARASSQPGSITFDPTSGPAGTRVHVEIAVEVSATTTYALTATQTSPQQGGCAQSQPIPGVPPFAVPPPNPSGVGPYQLAIVWPAALDQGPYWLCAAPTTGGGPTAASSAAFIVTPTATPTPSPTLTAVPTATATIARPTPTVVPRSSGTVDSSSAMPEAPIVGVVAALLAVAAGSLALGAVRRGRRGGGPARR